MTKLILSTSNIMNGGPSIIRRSTSEKSNTELTNSLRANFLASKLAFAPKSEGDKNSNTVTNSLQSDESHAAHQAKWTSKKDDTIYVPTIDFAISGLFEERSEYDITVKLFFLPSTRTSESSSHTQEAISLVLKELHVPSVDLLIVSFQDVSFDADDDEDENFEGDQNQETERLNDMLEIWQTLEALYAEGVVAQVGLAEFGSERLRKFLPRTKVRPSVDQINVRDCCVVPKSLIIYAKQENIELLTHNDCTNILPKGTIRDLLGSDEQGVHLLTGSSEGPDELAGEVEPQWVVKYTAVVRDRGVIENKGYFAMAELRP